MPQNSIKNYFRVISDYFSYKNGPNDLVWGLFSSLDVENYILPICRPLCTYLAPFGGAQMPKNSMKKLFSGFRLFLQQKWTQGFG
jgi:hypothetical protein